MFFFLLPIGHERGTALRWPWVTLAIILVCFAVYLVQLPGLRAAERLHQESFREALEYYLEHPYLEVDPRLVEGQVLLQRGTEEAGGGLLQEFFGGERPRRRGELRRQQATLDQLTAEWLAAREAHPYSRWGLVPASHEPFDLLTSIFVHAGLLHLLGNMLFLYLAAPPVEDVWGRPLFLVFYLAAGVFASQMFVSHYPNSTAPLVGASGAIAGVMGAFLIRYWAVKIKFFYFMWFGLRVWSGTFESPAWLMLPLWLANNLFSAYVTDQLDPEGGGGVAYWAHIWGFVFGVAVAAVIQLLKLEDRVLRRRIHARIGLVENPTLEEAHEARRRGSLTEARRLLEEELRRNPANRDAVVALWDVARDQKLAPEVAPRMLRCVWQELRDGNEEMALQHWDEVRVFAPGARIDPKLRVRMAELLAERGREPEAAELVRGAAGRARRLAPALLVRLARTAAKVDPATAGTVARNGLELAELAPELRGELEEIAAESARRAPPPAAAAPAPGPPAAGAAAPVGPAAEPPPQPAFGVMAAVPERVAADRIVIDLDGKGRVSLRFDRIRGLGAAEIRELGYQPYYVLDLFIDPPVPQAERVRLVRCLTSLFDPLALEPGEADAVGAFRTLVGRLRTAAGTGVYPEGVAIFESQPFPCFESVREYEEALRAAFSRGFGGRGGAAG